MQKDKDSCLKEIEVNEGVLNFKTPVRCLIAQSAEGLAFPISGSALMKVVRGKNSGIEGVQEKRASA